MTTLLSVFGGGLFIIPLLTLLGAIFFGYRAYQAHESGSLVLLDTDEIDPETGKIKVDVFGKPLKKWFPSDEKVPYSKIGQAVFSAILTVATIVIVIMMVLDK